jgi:hypothetical protein
MKYTSWAGLLAVISILLIILGAAAILPKPATVQPVTTYSQPNISMQFAMLEKPPAPPVTPYAIIIKPSTPVSASSTMVAALSQLKPQPAPVSQKPVITPVITPQPSPAYVPPQLLPQIPKVITQPATIPTYTFANLSNIPNFQSLVDQMRRDYIAALRKLPTEIAYTLAGTVKGIIEVQTDGSVKVVKVISSPSVVLTDIYVRNIEQFVTFPRSLALTGIEIDATFNPSVAGTATTAAK